MSPGKPSPAQPVLCSPTAHPHPHSQGCNRLCRALAATGSRSQKLLQEFLFLNSSPCCQLHTCSFTSSPLLIALSACRPDSQDGCSVFNQHLPLLLPPKRDTASLQAPPCSGAQHHRVSLPFPSISFPVPLPQYPQADCDVSSTAGSFTHAAASGEDPVSNSPCSVKRGLPHATLGILG